MRRDGLDAERAEDEREDERRRRVAVVDDDPELALADRVLVEGLEQLLRIDLARPHRIVDVADAVACRTPELAAVEVLLDLLLELGRQLDARLLVEADRDHLGVDRGEADVEAGRVVVRLQQVPPDRARKHAEVGDADARRVEPGDHRALDHPARGGRLAAGHDPRAPGKRRSQRDRELRHDLGRQVDVDEARDAVALEEPRRDTGLPDQVLVDLRAALDLLVRVDAHAGHEDALLADLDLVAERHALLQARVGADVARAADDRALDQAPRPMCVEASITERVGARALAERDARGRGPSTAPTWASGAMRQ